MITDKTLQQIFQNLWSDRIKFPRLWLPLGKQSNFFDLFFPGISNYAKLLAPAGLTVLVSYHRIVSAFSLISDIRGQRRIDFYINTGSSNCSFSSSSDINVEGPG